MDLFRLLLAILPFIVFSFILVFHRAVSTIKISAITLLLNVIIALLFWHSPLSVFLYSIPRGFLIALDIFFIIFGAILFLEILQKNKITDSLVFHLDASSPDPRIQTIMLAWFLEIFLEGIAGFGTPSIVVAPLLVAMGISPVNSVIISLLGNSASVPFGAVGTPIRVGFAGLSLDISRISSTTAIYNYIGFLVPIFMIWVLVLPKPNRIKLFLESLPFAIWSGVAYVMSAYIVSLFGIEFPSIIGPIIAVFLIVVTSRLGFFLPSSSFKMSKKTIQKTSVLSLKKVIYPYLLFIILLIFSKIFLSNHSLDLNQFSYKISFFNPGFVFIVTTIIVALNFKNKPSEVISIAKTSLEKSFEPFLVIGLMSAMVQLMDNTANPSLNLVSITKTISTLFDTKLLPLIAPFVGAFGSFITGSATVSNIMFSSSIHASSLSLGFDPIKILSLAVVGAGAGNMIAISDVMAAKTVVSSKINLRQLIITLLPFCLIYLILVALLGWLI